MNTPSSALCEICQTIDFDRGLRGAWDEKIALGTLRSILDKRHRCCFCRLIHDSLQQSTQEITLLDTTHDGRPILCKLWNTLGARSQVTKDGVKSEHLIQIALEGHWKREYTGLTFTVRRLASDLEESSLFLGRRVDEGKISFNTVKQWLRGCESWHTTADEYRGVGLIIHPLFSKWVLADLAI